MDMEEGEAKMCRLCGQYEKIYIDVFGEEGVKRYLGTKIHKKINILVGEKDPLLKAICVQCLGKLEFVCDFQEECRRTQQVLRAIAGKFTHIVIKIETYSGTHIYTSNSISLQTEVKTEESTSPVGTSSLDNNNSIEKNFNSTGSSQAEEHHVEVVKDSEQQKKRNTTPKILRSLRSQQQQQQVFKCNDKAAEKNPQTQSTETSLTR